MSPTPGAAVPARAGVRRFGQAAVTGSVTLLLAGAFAITAARAAAPEAQPPLAGRPLAEVLAELQSRGLPVVFTSGLVRHDMVVLAEPTGRRAREILEQVLAPHGLGVQEAPGGLLVVVRAAGTEESGAIAGRVVARGGRGGLPGANVRVLEAERAVTVDAEGRFLIAELPPAAYTLEASAPGFLEQRLGGIEVAAGAARRVELRLPPNPFVEEEIVVRPSRLTLLHDRPDASFSLGREEIDSLPHLGGDVFRATSLLPGTAANDVSAQFSVHGGRRDEVRILLDGQELYQAFHLQDFDNALSIVPARALSGVTLTTGAFPVSQGDRMGGVFDLRTVDAAPGRRFVLGLGVLDALAFGSGTFAADRGGWLASARRGSIDLAADLLGREDPRFWDAFGKVELATGRGVLSVRGLAAVDELEIDDVDEEGFERLDNDYRSTYVWLTHHAAPGAWLLVETSGSWADVRRDRGGAVNEEEGSFDVADRRRLRVLALTQAWTLRLGQRHLLRSGLEARRYDAELDYRRRLEPELVLVAPFASPRLEEHAFTGTLESEHLAAWVSDRATFGRLTAELGLRFDRHDATDDGLWSPRLNLAWKAGGRTVLRAAWGRFFQSQRPYELQVEDGETALRPAELAEHWVVGAERLLPVPVFGLEAVRLELFRREIDDPRPRYENLLEPLNVLPEIEPDRVRIAPQRGTAEGAEALLRGRWGSRLDWWAAYTWSRAEERIGGDTVRRQLDQPHALSLDVGYRLPREWRLNLAWRYHSGWPTTPVAAAFVGDPEEPEEEPELVGVFGPLRSQRLPAYHRLDLRASRRWQLRRGGLTFFVDVQNLYDRANLAGFDVALDDEEETLELEAERWPGIFPSFGFVLEL
ncbi:MAG TPA: TonB-dependent receptor [Thermoanaerobaculia bacterium]|nr:TonB-dependent receptor [Thermoanaerobaculia bacterium]